ADTEDALRRVSEMKAGDPGIASIYSTIQGLSSSDIYYEKKKELLEVIFKDNLALQSSISLKHRKDVAQDEPAPAAPAPTGTALVTPESLGFEAPLEPLTDETAF
ncbi:MAG TPA: hypothetical protein VHF22_12215, partial [Planctomycetota bacterium]|nr:hypothetical protein [Planctomycetota bacterium]